ncbi:zinc dependent phospholipase C family protein [archaeon]|nr:zinc dependent phospholipase C family protein [archaeon]
MAKQLFFCLLLSALILCANFAAAWNAETHKKIAENVYLGMEGMDGFNLSLMKQGAIAPDFVFKDYTNHHYPESFAKMLNWMNISRRAYHEGNIDLASYAFGVASHYISDSFVAPHYIANEDSNMHSKFENGAKISAGCKIKEDYALKGINTSKMKNDWQLFLNGTEGVASSELDDAQEAVYYLAGIAFGARCREKEPDNGIFFRIFGTLAVGALIGLVWFRQKHRG